MPSHRALVPLLTVLDELPASFYSKVLSTLFWALLILWYLPLVILEISSLLFGRRETSLINVRWSWPVVIKFSPMRSLDVCSYGKCLTLNFSGTWLVCPPKGFSYVIWVPSFLRRALRVEIPGVEMKAEGKLLAPRVHSEWVGRLRCEPRQSEFSALTILISAKSPVIWCCWSDTAVLEQGTLDMKNLRIRYL